MRFGWIALSCVLAGCGTAPAGGDAPTAEEDRAVEWRVLEVGSYARAANAEAGTMREPVLAVAATDERYRALWRELISMDSTPPPIDFTKATAVFLILGQKSTGGWGIEPTAVEVEGSSVRVISAIERPQRSGIVTMAFSGPFAVIAVDAPQLLEGVWTDDAGIVVASAAPEGSR